MITELEVWVVEGTAPIPGATWQVMGMFLSEAKANEMLSGFGVTCESPTLRRVTERTNTLGGRVRVTLYVPAVRSLTGDRP